MIVSFSYSHARHGIPGTQCLIIVYTMRTFDALGNLYYSPKTGQDGMQESFGKIPQSKISNRSRLKMKARVRLAVLKNSGDTILNY